MASRKVKDLAVKVGEYEKDGQTKGRYRNVGAMMKNGDGSFYLFLDRTFNPAGVPNPEGRGDLIVSVFDLQDNNQQPAPASTPAPPPPPTAAVEENIPF